jgi:hypothetical protein
MAVAGRQAVSFRPAADEAALVGATCGHRAVEHRAVATVDALATELRDRLVNQSGCTLDPRTAQPVGQVNAYAVSLDGYESRFDDLPSLDEIAEYLRRHDAVLRNRSAVYVGAWRERQTGACYLDLSELVTDRAAAESRGRAQRQRCIYHLATGAEIRLR